VPFYWRSLLRKSRLFTFLLGCGVALATGATPTVDGRGLTHIGTQKQLFIDDSIIMQTSHVMRVLNPVVKAPSNPIIKADRPWEGSYLRCNKVFYDETDRLFKMWYSVWPEFVATKDAGGGYRNNWTRKGDGFVREEVPDPYNFDFGDDSKRLLCYATSKDGFHWEKPNLGKVEFQGSRNNNILPAGTRSPDILDTHEQDPSRRFKAAASDFKFTGYHYGQINLFYSPDGMEWRPAPENKELDVANKKTRWGPSTFLGWDSIKGVYAIHIESCRHRGCPMAKRLVGRSESPDMIHWSEVETIMIPDERDPPDLEFYAMPTFFYEGVYIGMTWIFRTTEALHYPQLSFSRDGTNYTRPFREPLMRVGDSGDFDESMLLCNTPLFQDGRIWFYYSGGNHRAPERFLERGDKAVHAIGVATLPEDGFVSFLAGKLDPGKVLTRVLTFEGNQLSVVMKATQHNYGAGPVQVKVEIIDSTHEPIPGFTLEECDNLATTGKHRVSWKGNSDVGKLAGKPIQLRFTLRNVKLNSFQFLEE